MAGTYYAEAASEHFDPAGPNNSQGYIAHIATRAMIFIEAPDPIGLMCVVPVGMAEVSSCVVTVKEGEAVKKGDQIGYFQFGGSTHCLVFRKGVIAQFAARAIPQGVNGASRQRRGEFIAGRRELMPGAESSECGARRAAETHRCTVLASGTLSF